MSESTIPTHKHDGRKHHGRKPKVFAEVTAPYRIGVNPESFTDIPSSVQHGDSITFYLSGGRTAEATITVTPSGLFTSPDPITVKSIAPVTRTVSSRASGSYWITTETQPRNVGDTMSGTIRVGSGGTGEGV